LASSLTLVKLKRFERGSPLPVKRGARFIGSQIRRIILGSFRQNGEKGTDTDKIAG
jgi:hypothetical protein